MDSKIVSVKIYQVKASWTREMIDDLNNFDKMYRYKFENEFEKLLLIKYFNIEILDNEAYYSLMKIKELRKLKLMILNNDELSTLTKKIFDNSEYTTVEDMLTRKCSYEWAKEIDMEIAKSLKDYLLK